MTSTAEEPRPQATEEPHCLVDKRGRVLVVTLNRPAARNALSAEMMAIMREAWDQVDGDDDIRAMTGPACSPAPGARSAPAPT